MKRILGHVVSVCALAVVVGAAAPACVDDDVSIFVRSVLAPSTNRQGGICTWTDDPTQTELFEGVLDVGVRDNYLAVVLVGNQMIQRGDPNQVRAETNRVHIDGFVIRVTEPNGNVLGEFTSTGSGFADNAANNLPDYAVARPTLIDAPTAATIAGLIPGPGQSKLVVANIKAFGRSLGGVDVESSEHQFPIRVCNGCLISFNGADDPANPGIDCRLPLDTQAGQDSTPCVIGQDEVTPCQFCLDRPACQTR